MADAVSLAVPLAVVAALALAAALIISHFGVWRGPTPAKKRALLVTAHPDDEAMFFVPAVRALLRAGWQVGVLCLSNGSGDGVGDVRAAELRAAARLMGMTPSMVEVKDVPTLRDGLKEVWQAAHVAPLVAEAVAKHDAGLVVTFDAGGVSGHPNHIGVHHGVVLYASSTAGAVPCYALDTVFPVRKFSSVLDLLVSFCAYVACGGGRGGSRVFVTSIGPSLNHAAMAAHASQYVWFRKIFVFLSRYTFVNTLTAIRSGGRQKCN